MHESSFVPPYDAFLPRGPGGRLREATASRSLRVVSVGSLQTRVTTRPENASGPDMTAIGFNWAFLFDEKFVDVSDIAAEIGKETAAGTNRPRNRWWSAQVEGHPVRQYRPADELAHRLFKQAGYDKFPDTWDELLEAGTKLKKAGHPFGFELGHGFGDNHGWLYPLLWSYGGREVEADGKTIVIDSAETARAIDYCRRFYKGDHARGLSSWTDINQTTRHSCRSRSPATNNAESILWSAKRTSPTWPR